MTEINTENNYAEILDNCLDLVRRYATTVRTHRQSFRHHMLLEKYPEYTYHPDDLFIRENLLEHVGMLPVIATYLHPYCDTPETPINLGESLIILSIHDIGELAFGDYNTFSSEKNDTEEEKLGLTLLHNEKHKTLYKEFGTLNTTEAKYAKAIDKFTGEFLDHFIKPHESKIRYEHFIKKDLDEVIQMKLERKLPYLEWNPFLKELYKHSIIRLEKIFSGETPPEKTYVKK